MIEQVFKSINILVILLCLVILFFYLVIKFINTLLKSNEGRLNQTFKYWVGPKEVGFVLNKGKIDKIIPSNSFYNTNRDNFKAIHLDNRN